MKLPGRLFAREIHHSFGRVSIALPSDHKLPKYRRAHADYDRFLPHLATFIESGKTVIDIGANCGDTLAAMFSANPALRYVCIEPDDGFYAYLERNVAGIVAADSSAAVRTIKSLVGNSVVAASLAGSGGTKHAVPSAEGQMKSCRLDDILASENCRQIRLIKSDVDGFDFDVLDSATSVLAQSKALVYFECQLADGIQAAGFDASIKSLIACGYSDWSVFDNFGQFMLRTSDPGMLTQLLAYLAGQNRARSTRTIYYYDLLAATGTDAALVGEVLRSYVRSGD